MKTKILLTVLFSIGIIGITSAQGFSKNERFGGPRHAEIARMHERHEIAADRRISRHERKRMRREERRHERWMRHHRHYSRF